MAIRAVVFDIGGVLQIVSDLGVNRSWEARLGLPPGAIQERTSDLAAQGAIGATTWANVENEIRDRLGLDPAQLAAYTDDLWCEYLGVANTELIEYAGRLRPRYRTGILSNSFVGAREREQAAFGFDDLVDELVYSHEVGMSKPDPRVFALTCERLNVRPEEMIFVDDWEDAVAGARSAGIHAIHYQDNSQVITEIERAT
jgi:epoxide hydrolase-like predicted phosphatase